MNISENELAWWTDQRDWLTEARTRTTDPAALEDLRLAEAIAVRNVDRLTVYESNQTH